MGEIGQISFEEAIDQVDYLLARAEYCRPLQRYIELFGRESVLVLYYDDLVADPEGFLTRAQTFIGVEASVPRDVREWRNVTGRPRFPALTNLAMRNRIRLKRYGLEWFVDLLKRLRLAFWFRWLQAQVQPYARKPTVEPETERRLRQHFLPDVECVERLLDVDLSRWKPTGPPSTTRQ